MATPGVQAFVGREAELARLVDALDRDRPIVIVGEAGIGKTATVRVAASRADRTLLEGGGFATLAAMPFLAVSRAAGATLAGDAGRLASILERRVGPDVLFIDDLHWVDPHSRSVLSLLHGRLAFVTAVRLGDADAEEAIRFATTTLGCDVIELGALDAAAASQLAHDHFPDLGPPAIERLVARAGGNPFLVQQLALGGVHDASLARVLEARLAVLPDQVRVAARVLAVADRPLRRSGIPHANQLIEAGLAVAHDDVVQLRHALLGESIRTGLSEPERAAAHRSAAGLVDDVVEAARHLAAAGDAADAAHLARSALDGQDDPRRLADLLVVIADATGDGSDRVAASWALMEAADYLGVIALHERGSEPGSQAIADECDVLAARALYRLGRSAESRPIVDALTARGVDPRSTTASLLAIERGLHLANVDGDAAAALQVVQDQLDFHEPESADWLRIRLFIEALKPYLGRSSDPAILVAGAEAAMVGHDRSAAEARVRNAATSILISDGPAAAYAYLLDSSDRFDGLGLDLHADHLRASAVSAAVEAGLFAEAVALGQAVLERPSLPRARRLAAANAAIALAYLGRAEAASAVLDEVPIESLDRSDRQEQLMSRMELSYFGGRPDLALEQADELLALVDRENPDIVLPSLTRAWARLDTDRSIGDFPPIPAFRTIAAAAPELAAMRDLEAGRFDQAATGFATAAAGWAGYVGAREIVCRWAAGEALRRAGRTGSAIDALKAALAAADAMSFVPMAARIRRSLRLAGVRSTTTERSSGRSPLALTAREAELVALVERGLSNIEIARRLGLGRPTVARMLASAMGKLGVDNRTQLAALASE